MLKSIAIVVGSYLLSFVLVLATDPLLSRLFPWPVSCWIGLQLAGRRTGSPSA